MEICKKCQTSNSEDAKFCSNCGITMLIDDKINIIKFLFSPVGRVNRIMYLFGYLLAYTALLFITLIGFSWILSFFIDKQEGLMLNIPIIIMLIGIWYPYIIITIKRLHDINKSGWLSILMFIPLANIWLLFVTSFSKGTTGENKYGEDPLNHEYNQKIPLTSYLFLTLLIGFIIYVSIYTNSVHSKLKAELSGYNMNFPHTTGNLQYRNITINENIMYFDIKLLTVDKEYININKEVNTTRYNLQNSLCNNKISHEILNDGGKYAYTYHDKNNIFIAEIIIDINKCQN